MNKIYIASVLILFCICLVIGIFTKKSYIDDTSFRKYIDSNEVEFNEYEDINNQFVKDSDVKNLDMLDEQSDCIVRVCVEPECERYLYSNMSVSQAKVLENYKGNTGDYIYIVEPIGVYKNENNIWVDAVWGYYWMRDGEEYILFLDKYSNMHIGRDEYIYLPVSASRGHYCITDGRKETDEVREAIKEDILNKYIN